MYKTSYKLFYGKFCALKKSEISLFVFKLRKERQNFYCWTFLKLCFNCDPLKILRSVQIFILKIVGYCSKMKKKVWNCQCLSLRFSENIFRKNQKFRALAKAFEKRVSIPLCSWLFFEKMFHKIFLLFLLHIHSTTY